MRIAKHCCQGNETCYAVTVKDADLAQSLETKRTLSNTQKPFLLWDSSLTTFLFLAFFSWCHKHAFCSLQHHTLFKVSLASTALEHFRAVAAVSLLHFLYSTGTRHKCFKLKIQVDTLHFYLYCLSWLNAVWHLSHLAQLEGNLSSDCLGMSRPIPVL